MSGHTQFGKRQLYNSRQLPESSCFADYEAFEVEDLDNGDEGKGAESYTRMSDVCQKVKFSTGQQVC